MKKPPYEYRIGIIMILLTAVPIGATQLGWYLYGKQVGFDFGMIAGTFSVILAGYLMYQKGWRDEDGDDYGRRNTFNTAIAAVMELLNEVGKHNEKDQQTLAVRHEALISAVLLLSPVAPHICHSLWHALGRTDSVIDASWPMLDEEALVRSTITLVLQVNGKVRGKIEVAADISREDIEKIALADENVQRFVEGNTIRKIIVVPGRLVNIVAN